jgi:hypothetical protein
MKFEAFTAVMENIISWERYGAVWHKFTNDSEEPGTHNFRVED